MGNPLVRFCEGQGYNCDMDQSCGTAAKAGGNGENKPFPKSRKSLVYSKIMEKSFDG